MSQFGAASDYLKKTLPMYYTTTVVLSSITYSNSNIEGDETATVTGTSSLNCYVVRKARPWNFDKSGFIEGGDALLIAPYDTTIARGDKITWNSNDYRVQTVLDRDQLTGTISYKACNLVLLQ
jgi:hypothetical protein